jgi:hypothetical protein
MADKSWNEVIIEWALMIKLFLVAFHLFYLISHRFTTLLDSLKKCIFTDHKMIVLMSWWFLSPWVCLFSSHWTKISWFENYLIRLLWFLLKLHIFIFSHRGILYIFSKEKAASTTRSARPEELLQDLQSWHAVHTRRSKYMSNQQQMGFATIFW